MWTLVSEQDSSHVKKLGLRCLGDNIKSPKLQFVQNPPSSAITRRVSSARTVRRAGSVVKQTSGSLFIHQSRCLARDLGVLCYNLIRRAKTNALAALSLGVGFAQNFAYTEVEMVATGETSDSREVQ